MACLLAALVAGACGAASPSTSTTNGAATSAAPAGDTAAPSGAEAHSPWVGTFGAMSSDEAHTRLVAHEGERGWTASLDSYALQVECDYTEVAGSRTASTIRAHWVCRSVQDEEVVSAEGVTTLTLQPNGHLTGDFGAGTLDLAPPVPPSAPFALERFAGRWYGSAVLADEEIGATLRVENGALVGTAEASFSDRVECTIAERPSGHDRGRVQVHVACVCEYEHAYDFERDCALELLGDVPGIASADCFDDHVELRPESADAPAPVVD